MTSKERVLMAIEHQEPDRVPVCATYVPEINKQLCDKYGCYGDDIGVLMGNDMVKVASGLENSFYMNDEPEYVDSYGIKWKNIKNATGHYTEVYDHPLRHSDDLETVMMPDANKDYKVLNAVKEGVEKYGKDKWIVGSCQCSIFEAAWYMRGIDRFLMDMVLDEDFTEGLLDAVMSYPLQMGLNFIDAGVDMVWLGDDIATQMNLMFSPEMYRKYLKPRYAAILGEFKKRNPKIKLCYHSCGNVEGLIPDLIDVGFDVLNPIQPSAMEVAHIKKTYGDKITLFGGMDIQQILPFGTVKEVKNEVKRIMDICAPGGGFILSPAHHIQSDTSIENVEAFYDAWREYRDYD